MNKTFYIVENDKLQEYTRTGSCTKCGECCYKKTIGIQMRAEISLGGDDGIDDADLEEWEGWSSHFDQGFWWWWKLDTRDKDEESKCCSLAEDGVTCKEWKGENWKAICRYWPVHPDNLKEFPNCGFKFIREEKNGD